MKRRVLTCLLLLSMLMSLLPMAAFAEELPGEIQTEDAEFAEEFPEMIEEQPEETGVTEESAEPEETENEDNNAKEVNSSEEITEDAGLDELTALANEESINGILSEQAEYLDEEVYDYAVLNSEQLNASRNIILPWVTMTGLTIHKGDTATLRFGLFNYTSTSNQRYNVFIYKGTEVSTANRVVNWYKSCSSYSTGMSSLSLTWDTSSLATGTYTMYYFTSYYSNSSWKIDSSTYDSMSITITSSTNPLVNFTIGNSSVKYSDNSTISICSTDSTSTYTVYLNPSNTTSDRSNLTASSGNTSIFTVSSFGGYLTITPKTTGSANLTVSIGGVSEEFTISIGHVWNSGTISSDNLTVSYTCTECGEVKTESVEQMTLGTTYSGQLAGEKGLSKYYGFQATKNQYYIIFFSPSVYNNAKVYCINSAGEKSEVALTAEDSKYYEEFYCIYNGNYAIQIENSGQTQVDYSVTLYYLVDEEGTRITADHFGWYVFDGKSYWYENGIQQGTYDDANGVVGDGTIRGREIYDSASDGWYWLDACYDGAKAVSKEVWMPYIYQNEANWGDSEIWSNANASDSGMAQQVHDAIVNGTGKWVRYDANGKMYKGWCTINSSSEFSYCQNQLGNTYYYDSKTGLMAKGWLTIGGKTYHFDETTGVLIG